MREGGETLEGKELQRCEEGRTLHLIIMVCEVFFFPSFCRLVIDFDTSGEIMLRGGRPELLTKHRGSCWSLEENC